MNTNKYYFTNSFESNNLKMLAVEAKGLFEKYKYVVQIFDLNNKELQGSTAGHTLFLMKLNNKSIFSSNPSSESSSTDSKSCQRLSIPVTRNPEDLNAPKRGLPLIDTLEEVHHSTTLETSTAVRCQTVLVSPRNQTILNPAIDETASKDEQFIPPTVSTRSPVAGNQESSRSAEIVKMTVNLSMAEKELQSPAKVVGNVNQGNLESTQYAKITKKASTSAVDDSISRTLIQNDQMEVVSDKSKDSPNSMENAEKSDSPNSPNKDSICPAEGIGNDSKPTENWIPSPTKKSKIELGGKTEVDVEVPCNSEDNASPTTFQSSPSVYTSDSKNDNTGSPVVSELKTKPKRKIFNWIITLPETRISPLNVSAANSPSSDNASAENDPSSTPSVAATEKIEKSSESKATSKSIEDALNQSLIKLNSLLFFRNTAMERRYTSFLNFQKSMKFLNPFVQNIGQIVLNINVSAEKYSTEELKTTITDANAMAIELENKLKKRKTEGDIGVDTFRTYLQQFKQLKENYELFTDQSKSKITAEALQVYESKFKAVWKKMDEMILLEDSKKALFSQMAFDFENLMSKFIKCLVLVGILLPR